MSMEYIEDPYELNGKIMTQLLRLVGPTGRAQVIASMAGLVGNRKGYNARGDDAGCAAALCDKHASTVILDYATHIDNLVDATRGSRVEAL